VREGPLAGMEGIFEGPAGPAERVRILLRFLGECNRAVVPLDILEGAAPRPHPPRRTRGKGRKIRRHVDKLHVDTLQVAHYRSKRGLV